MLKYFLPAFVSLSMLPVTLPAQLQILKLTGRVTPASQYEKRGDFILYKKPDECKAVIFRCDNDEVADSLRGFIENNPSIAINELHSGVGMVGRYTADQVHFRKGQNHNVPNGFWRVGLTENRQVEDKTVFVQIREIVPDERFHKLNKFDLFSVIYEDGREDVLYDPDTSDGGDPSEQEVRNYIKGEQYAMATYHKPIQGPAGAAVGLSSVFALGFYSPPVIFAYALGVSRHNPRHIPPSSLIDDETFNSEHFRNGYQKYARNKKARQSLIWGGIGFAVGFPVFLAIFHE